MAGAVIEKLPTKKLVLLSVCLLLVEILFLLVGAFYAPQPTHVVGPAPLKSCRENSNNPDELLLPNTCNQVAIESTTDPTLTPDKVTFTNIVPYNKNHHIVRWFQYMLCFANMRIQFKEENPVGKDGDPVLTLQLRIAYSDDDEPHKLPGKWTEFARSEENRTLVCHFPYEKSKEYEGFEYNCDPIFIFQLGSLPHKRYLINLMLRTGLHDPDARQSNRNIGKVVDIEYIAMMQTGGFTAIWLGMNTALFIAMMCPIVWFWNRVRSLERKSMLIEKASFVLGLSMVFSNFPVEFFTIMFDVPWMLLFTDIRQGLFYAILFSFCVIFAGENRMSHPNKLSTYKWHLGCIFTTSLALLSFELAERGIQLVNPFGTVWKHPAFGYGLLVVGGISAVFYLILVGYLVFKDFYFISYKEMLPNKQADGTQSLAGRLKGLKLLTVATVVLSVVFVYLEQILGGVFKEWFALNLQISSAFFTGVYAWWNIYVFTILVMLAPSCKVSVITSELDDLHQPMLDTSSTEDDQAHSPMTDDDKETNQVS